MRNCAAAELRQIVATKTPTASVFAMPGEWSMADVLRGDLAAARKTWLDVVRHDPEARAKREKATFWPSPTTNGNRLTSMPCGILREPG